MPPFPERHSSILAKLKAKNPNTDGTISKSEAVGESYALNSTKVSFQLYYYLFCYICVYQ